MTVLWIADTLHNIISYAYVVEFYNFPKFGIYT
jgi:hypothetical protein